MKTKGAPKFTPEKVAELHNPPTRRVRRTKSGFGRQVIFSSKCCFIACVNFAHTLLTFALIQVSSYLL